MSAIIPLASALPCHIAITTHANFSDLIRDRYVLAAIGFAKKAEILDKKRPLFTIGLPSLLEAETVTEVWLSSTPVTYGQYADITYSHNDDVLFGHLLLNEAHFSDLRQASQMAYEQVFELLNQSGYDYLLRMWNYFPAITLQYGELNRYQWFCLGRQDALDKYGNFAYSPPAATAIGTEQAGLQVYFLAAKRAGMQLENPRQVSAFLYPRQYGPVSPAFSRATVKDWGMGKHLYISGTTSIVGHETLHINDPLGQLDETLANLQALLMHGQATLGLPIKSVGELVQLKVYIHDATLFPAIQQRLQSALAGSAVHILYLRGDVCRSELMVEMEGIYA